MICVDKCFMLSEDFRDLLGTSLAHFGQCWLPKGVQDQIETSSKSGSKSNPVFDNVLTGFGLHLSIKTCAKMYPTIDKRIEPKISRKQTKVRLVTR